jgi:hypothetical protein
MRLEAGQSYMAKLPGQTSGQDIDQGLDRERIKQRQVALRTQPANQRVPAVRR